jgi:hypothetical protein
MRRGALISFLIHGALLLAILITLPPEALPTSVDTSVDVDLVGPSVPQHSTVTAKGQGPTKTPTVHIAPLSQTAPKPQQIVAPPPLPPPPPPSEDKTVTAKPPTPTAPPPPTISPTLSLPKPPPPRPHLPPKPTAPAKSATHQPHVVKTPVPLSSTVLNTLMNLQSFQKQEKPPTAKYNPDQGGAPTVGGSTQSAANSGLSQANRDAIGSHVRPCFDVDAGAPGLSTFSVNLIVTTDSTGTAREAVVAPQDQDKMGDPIFNAFAQRAIAAVLNYQCATLPLPSYMLGQNQTLLFDFTPGD